MKPWNIEICDITLRYGGKFLQSIFTYDQKVEISQILDKIGIEVIEAGFPAFSSKDKECVKYVANLGLDSRITCSARAQKADINVAIDCDVDMVDIFIPVSNQHITDKSQKPFESRFETSLELIDYSHDHGLQVKLTLMDISNIDTKLLTNCCESIAEHGALIVGFTDSTGSMIPVQIFKKISDIVTAVNRPVSVEYHNDLGCATANTITAAGAGAFQLCVSSNGIGEGAGYAALEEVLVALRIQGGVDRYDLSLLTSLSRAVEKYSDISISNKKPIVGRDVFSYQSREDVLPSILGNPLTYEIINPELIGGKRDFLIGKITDDHVLMNLVNKLGYNISEKQFKKILDEVKIYAEVKANLPTSQIIDIINKTVNDSK